MDEAKSIKTLMGTNVHLDLGMGGKLVDQKVYRFIIGSLLYLCASSPDIMLSICMRARFQAALKKIPYEGGEENHEIFSSHIEPRPMVSQGFPF
jgi:hypothetical protein